MYVGSIEIVHRLGGLADKLSQISKKWFHELMTSHLTRNDTYLSNRHGH